MMQTRFNRLIRAALPALFLLISGPVAAQMDISAEARAALRAEIRAYLMENPEIIFEAVAEFERRTASAQSDMDQTLVEINAESIFADPASWEGGNPDGDIVLVEFADYRCSFCRRAFEQVMEFMGVDGNVRFVIKELPILGPQSELAARFAIAVLQIAGPDVYFRAHEALMTGATEPTDAGLTQLAVTLGLDPATVVSRMQTSEVTDVIRENRALAQRLQINGTPTFAIAQGTPGAWQRFELLRGFLPASDLGLLAADLRG
jgi:protein-disulfide isomerase